MTLSHIRYIILFLVRLALCGTTCAFVPSTTSASQVPCRHTLCPAKVTAQEPTEAAQPRRRDTALSRQMRQMQSDISKDEKVQLYLQSLRGQNLNTDDAAADGMEMLVVEMEAGDDSLPLTYDPARLEAYFSRRPNAVRTRLLQVLTTSAPLILQLVLDVIQKKVSEKESTRAGQLREVLTSLGPFFIKIGQALSIRPDILGPKAMVELQRLCDKVPCFDNALAHQTIVKELGRTVDEVFSEITPDPIAAASLGQVYKGRVRATGEVVAIKVQRPFVLETVSLDLHLMRQLGLQLRKVPWLRGRTDVVALVDEFGPRFYQELDYEQEGRNGHRIAEDMKSIPQIVVPVPISDLCTRRVHVAQWIDGEKLTTSSATDILELVSVGVVAYLTQLLDTGFFHADPHVANLLRTPEGKLVMLDFGLMTELDPNQKFGMVEAISHLVHRDYSRIGEDFVNLGFIPEGTDLTPLIPALSKVFDAALAGGGAKSINFNELSADLAEITFKFPFRIPPYFALIIRAIGVLEGIALSVRPDFAIVDEAYPWLSKKLLTDEHPRLRAALRYMIYGTSGTFDVDRLLDLLQAFETLQATSKFQTMDEQSRAAMRAATDKNPRVMTSQQATTRDALVFLFAPEGAFFREFLLDEVAKGIDATSRDGLRSLAAIVGLRGPLVPPLIKALVPRLNAQDEKVIQNLQKMLAFFMGQDADELAAGSGTSGQAVPMPGFGLVGIRGGGSAARVGALPGLLDSRDQIAMARDLAPVIRELSPQMRQFGLQIIGRLTERVALRLIRFTRQALLGPDMPAAGRRR